MPDDPVLFRGGPIHVMGSTWTPGDLPEALMVDGGRVSAVGNLERLRASARRTPREIDLDGRALLPGFVDAHAHTLLLGSRLDWVDLSAARSVADVVELLSQRAQTRTDGPVLGYGYDQSRLAEQRHPQVADLDRVSQTRPVLIQHASGHGYAVNHVALHQASITASTPTPDGGRIDRDAAGHPTGVVFDTACDLLTGPHGVKVGNHGPNIHLASGEERAHRLFSLGQEAFLAAGVTTVCDAQVTELEMATYLQARDRGELRMRAHLMALSSNLDHLRNLGMVSTLGDDWLEFYGVKLYADGSVIARTAYLGGDSCCGTPSPNGYLYHEPAELSELIRTAHTMGLRAAVHAQGEVPIDLVLDAVRQAQAAADRPRLHHRIEHCGFPSQSHIDQMSELGVVPVPQPTQTHLFGDSLIADYGNYGGRLYPLGSFECAGLPIVLSSDAPVTMPGPLRAAWAATTRLTTSGAVAGGREQQVRRTNALQGITSTPGQLLGRSDIGTLTPGSQADLVLLDTDPVASPVAALHDAAVTETWVAGQCAWAAEQSQRPASATTRNEESS